MRRTKNSSAKRKTNSARDCDPSAAAILGSGRKEQTYIQELHEGETHSATDEMRMNIAELVDRVHVDERVVAGIAIGELLTDEQAMARGIVGDSPEAMES